METKIPGSWATEKMQKKLPTALWVFAFAAIGVVNARIPASCGGEILYAPYKNDGTNLQILALNLHSGNSSVFFDLGVATASQPVFAVRGHTLVYQVIAGSAIVQADLRTRKQTGTVGGANIGCIDFAFDEDLYVCRCAPSSHTPPWSRRM